MSDMPASLNLTLLHAIRSDLAEVKARLGMLEAQFAHPDRRLGGEVEPVQRRVNFSNF